MEDLYLDDIFTYGILIAIALLPFLLIGIDIVFAVKKKKSIIFECIAFGFGGIYMFLGWVLWDPMPWEEPLNFYGFSTANEPIRSEHSLTLVVIALIGFLCYLILKYAKKLSPLGKVFGIAGLYGGIIVCAAFLFQMLCMGRPEGWTGLEFFADNVFYVWSECLVPILFLIHAVKMFVGFVREQAKLQEEVSYEEKGFLNKCNRFLLKGGNLYWMALILMFPLYGIVICILCLFGQKPDSLIKAFTETSDWVLSGKISPPPVREDVHYLCTVALSGHEELVKPLRYGIRRGEKIVVNRQLCVANAFEQLLEERTPRFHRAVRHFYDTYGYPISRWIRTPWSADLVYLMMKPLEWVFVFILYLFDEKPENRIAGQYLPKE